jgi:CBS domain-containing protein
MSVQELIRRPVETLPPTASCVAAAELMRDMRVGSVVVTEEGRPIGIVTDRDLAVRVLAEARDATRVTLREVMSAHPIFLSVESTVEEALRTMREMGVRRLPIVDRGKLAGVLSMDDVLMSLGRQLGLIGTAIAVELGSDAGESRRIGQSSKGVEDEGSFTA